MTSDGVELQDINVGDSDDDLKIKRRVFPRTSLLKGILNMSKKGLVSMFKVHHTPFKRQKGELIPKDFRYIKK